MAKDHDDCVCALTGWVGVVSFVFLVSRLAFALPQRARSVMAFGLAAALSVAVLPSAALAQGGPSPAAGNEAKARYEALFQRNLLNPADLDAAFQFAEAATAVGDYEAAIGALERMVFYNPDLPRVRLELGVLYFRLGSFEMARSYFTTAITGPDVPSDVRNRVNAFLSEIDRRLKPAQWSGFAQAGLRYQTNANAGPNSLSIRALGFDAVLNQQFRKRPDWNTFALAGFRHVYDFGNQRGDAFETSVIGYYSAQHRFARLNTGLVEVNLGPRLALMPDAWMGSAIKPYATFTSVALGDAPYLGSWGGGVLLSFPVGLSVIEPGVEVRNRVYQSSSDYRGAPEQTGTFVSAYVQGSGALFDRLRWQGKVAFNRAEARFAYYTFDQFVADLSFPYEFEAPFAGITRRWTVSPSFGFSRTSYEAPNFVIDPNVRREDTEIRAGVLLDAPLTDLAGLSAQVLYTKVDSNIRNFDTRNLSVLFGPTLRF